MTDEIEKPTIAPPPPAATAAPRCGNTSCVCGRQCECPYGGCSCLVVEPDGDDQLRQPPLTSNTEASSTDGIPSQQQQQPPQQLVNVNVGVLGHVNSGKTSLVRALSTTLSTAALDKHPQARERGMTIDLGFSSFSTQAPVGNNFPPSITKVQYTLVDCPGHASLIRTIINGAQIIDRMLLVIDVTKGIQAQTAECLVIGEILAPDLIVVLNKIDLVPENERNERLLTVQQTIHKALQSTRFADAPMVPIAAHVGGDAIPTTPAVAPNLAPLTSHNLIELVRLIQTTTFFPQRAGVDNPFYFSVDHAFPIKGSGQILTGTVLSGRAQINQEIEIPQLGVTRKIKSIQRFKQPVSSIEQGDRAAISVTNLDSSKLERGVACTPGTVPSSSCVLALVRKVKYFDRPCPSGSKVHITIGPTTTLATCSFFGAKQLKDVAKSFVGKPIPGDCKQLLDGECEFDEGLLSGGKQAGGPVLQWVLLEFEESVLCPGIGQLLGSRLDTDVSAGTCRIAFYGTVAKVLSSKEALHEHVRVFKRKERSGTVDRVEAEGGKASAAAAAIAPGRVVDSLIGKGLFKKDSDISAFLGLKVVMQVAPPKGDGGDVTLSSSTLVDESTGVIESSFGKTGKFRVVFRTGHGTTARAGDKISLRFKKYMWEVDDGTGKKTLSQG